MLGLVVFLLLQLASVSASSKERLGEAIISGDRSDSLVFLTESELFEDWSDGKDKSIRTMLSSLTEVNHSIFIDVIFVGISEQEGLTKVTDPRCAHSLSGIITKHAQCDFTRWRCVGP